MADFDDTPTNLAKPVTSATITIRVIKSFEYRVAKPLVLHDLDLTQTTVGDLKQRVKTGISSGILHFIICTADLCHKQSRLRQDGSLTKPWNLVGLRNICQCISHFCSDTIKLYTKAHGAKVCLLSEQISEVTDKL
jgi:hypothetical protein